MPSRSRRTVTRSPALPSQAHSPPGRPSGWVRASRLTIVTSVPGATRSTLGLKHSSVRARVVPRPSVDGRWQPPPAAAGGAAARTAAARTVDSRTRSLRRRMAVSRVGDGLALPTPAGRPGFRPRFTWVKAVDVSPAPNRAVGYSPQGEVAGPLGVAAVSRWLRYRSPRALQHLRGRHGTVPQPRPGCREHADSVCWPGTPLNPNIRSQTSYPPPRILPCGTPRSGSRSLQRQRRWRCSPGTPERPDSPTTSVFDW